MPLAWDRSYEVGIQIVDSQHLRLVQLIASLQGSMAAGRGRTILDRLLDEVFDYAKVHFVTEEQIMEDARYPLLENHRAQHLRLLSSLEALRRRLAKSVGVPSGDVLDFLLSWLGQHTLGHDAAMARYVISVRDSPRLDLILGSRRTPASC